MEAWRRRLEVVAGHVAAERHQQEAEEQRAGSSLLVECCCALPPEEEASAAASLDHNAAACSSPGLDAAAAAATRAGLAVEASSSGSSGSSVSSSGRDGSAAHWGALDDSCVFCRIVQGRSPCHKVYENEECICILDSNPLCPGHTLVLPKRHFPSLESAPPTVAAAMCAAVPRVSRAILQATNTDSFNMLANCGRSAGQVVFHLHFHIIPRRKNDGLWRSEGGFSRPINDSLRAIRMAGSIRSCLEDSNCLS
eukprot:jgi/Chlat1/3663/Chrsp24S03847